MTRRKLNVDDELAGIRRKNAASTRKWNKENPNNRISQGMPEGWKRPSVQESVDYYRKYIDERRDNDPALSTKSNNRFKNLAIGSGRQWLGQQTNAFATILPKSYLNRDLTSRMRREAYKTGTAVRRPMGGKNRAGVTTMAQTRQANNVYKTRANATEKVLKNTKNSMKREADYQINKGTEQVGKAKEGLGKGGQFAVDLGSQMLQWGADALVGTVTGSALVPMFSRAFGGQAQQARLEGANEKQQILSGLGAGAVEVATEKLFSPYRLMKSTVGRGLGDNLTERAAYSIAKKLMKGVPNETAYKAIRGITKGVLGMAEEGSEEFLATMAQPVYERIYKKDALSQYGQKDFWKGAGSDFVMGAAMGGVLGGASGAINRFSSPTTTYDDKTKAKIIDNAIEQASPEDTEVYEYAKTLKKQLSQGEQVFDAQITDLLGKSIGTKIKPFQKMRNAGNVDAYIPEDATAIEAEKIGAVMGDHVEDEAEVIAPMLIEAGVPAEQVEADAQAIARIEYGTATQNDYELANPENLATRAVIADVIKTNLPTDRREIASTLASHGRIVKTTIQPEVIKQAGIDARAEIFETFTSAMSDEAADAFADGMENVAIKDMPQYMEAFAVAYEGGRVNIPADMVQSKLPEAIKTVAYNEGNKVYKAEAEATEKAQSKVKKTKRKAGTVQITEAQKKELAGKADVNAFKMIAETTGKNIVFMDSIDTKKHKDVANGKYQNGTIYLSVKADAPLIDVFKHELTHNLQETAPKEYKELKDYIIKKFYDYSPTAYDNAVRHMIKHYRDGGVDITREQAEDELIADATDVFFKDESAIQDLVNENRTLGEKLLDGIRALLDTFHRLATGGKKGKWLEDIGALEEAERLWVKALNASVGTEVDRSKTEFRPSPKNVVGTFVEDGTIQYSLATETEDLPKRKFSAGSFKGIGNADTVQRSVRYVRNKAFKKTKQADMVPVSDAFFDDMMDFMKKAEETYQYIGLEDVNNARVKVTYKKNGNPEKIVVTALVKNGDYPINFDFSTICKKRVAMQKVLGAIYAEHGENAENLVDEIDLSPKALHEINVILQENGFETACAVCFVEARRYHNQAYMDKILDTWNGYIDEHYKDADQFRLWNMKLEDIDTARVRKALKKYQTLRKANKADTFDKKVAALIDSDPFFQKRLTTLDLISPNAEEVMVGIADKDISLLGFIKASRGASAPKEVIAFTAYNGEVALMPDYKGTGAKKQPVEIYLKEVGGVRGQSFSDFQIENVYDYLQLLGDLVARKFVSHFYTKEIAFVDIFGQTGIKINMSLVCDIDKNVPNDHAGLVLDANGVWQYNFGEQSIDFAKAIEFQNKEGYRGNVGTILVGMSKYHILKALDDENIRYIIPYHKSGLPIDIQRVTHIGKATDYTKVQNTLSIRSIKKPILKKNGKPSGKYEDAGFDLQERYKELGDWKAVIDELNSHLQETDPAKKWKVTVKKYGNGTADYDVYEALDRLGDPRKVADEYGEYCVSNGLLPQFFEFSTHPNYYKVSIFDFNVTKDGAGNEAAPQVPPILKFTGYDATKGELDTTQLKETIGKYMAEQNEYNYNHYHAVNEDTGNTKFADTMAQVRDNLEKFRKDLDDSSEAEDEYETKEYQLQLKSSVEDDTEELDYQLKSEAKLERKISRQEEKIQKLKEEFKRSKVARPDEKGAGKAVNALIEEYTGKRNQRLHAETMKDLELVYKEVRAKDPDWNVVDYVIDGMADNILDKAEILHDELWQEYSDLRQTLKNTTIKMGSDWKNLTDANDVKRSYFGRVNIAYKTGTPIDTFYQELSEQYPQFFDSSEYTNGVDQLYSIINALDEIKPYVETYDAEEIKEFKNEVKSDLYTMAYELTTHKTFADKKYEEKKEAVKKQKAKDKRKLDEVRAKAREDKKEAVEKVKAERNAFIEKQKEKTRERLDKKDKYYQDKLDKLRQTTREKRDRKHYLERIEINSQWLSERLLRPSDAKHLPQNYRQAISKLLGSLDFSTKRGEQLEAKNGKPTQKKIKLEQLRATYESIASEETADIPVDGELRRLMEQLAPKVENKRLSELSVEELRDINKIIREIRHTVMNANRMFADEQRKAVSDTAEQAIRNMEMLRGLNTKLVKMLKKKKGYKYVDDFFNWINTSPYDAFTYLGSTFSEMFMNISKGYDKHVANLKQTSEFLKEINKDNQFKKWEDADPIKIPISKGTIEITIPQLMSLYCLYKRPQAFEHLAASGFVIAESEKKGKILKDVVEKKWVRPAFDDYSIMFSEEYLKPEYRKAADEMQKYMSTVCAGWGNETSMKLFGYKKYTEDNYFPITSEKDFLKSRHDGNKAESKIRNMSASKPLTPNASNPILALNIFDVFAEHVNMMSQYEALVPAITDMERVVNYVSRDDGTISGSVKKTITDVFGDNATHYVNTFLSDLNMNYTTNNDVAIPARMIANLKKARVGANLRVLLQQASSIVRASLVISPKYLTKGLTANKSDYKEMREKNSLAYFKSLGYYSMDMGRSLKDAVMGETSLSDKLFMEIYGKADDIAWTAMWKACKSEAKEEYPDLEGDAYWDKVNERFNIVIYRTQVVDTPLMRSQIMRKNELAPKVLTSFMAEPTKTWNMLRTETVMATRDYLRGNKKQAKKRMARVLGTYLSASIAVSASAAIMDAMRGGGDDDEDKTFLEKFGKYTFENTLDNMNPMTLLPVLKDVASLMHGFDVTRMDMDGIADLIDSFKYWSNDRVTPAFALSKTIKGISAVTGIPIGNLVRDSSALAKEIYALVDKDSAEYESIKFRYNLENNLSKYAGAYAKSQAKGNTGTAQKIEKDVLKKVDKEKWQKSVQYQERKMTVDTAVNFMLDNNPAEARKAVARYASTHNKKYEQVWASVEREYEKAQEERKKGFMGFLKNIK